MEFFRIHMLLAPLRLVLILQYLTNPSIMVLSSLVRRHDRYFVIHLLEPAINRCLYGDLCKLEVQYRYGRFSSTSDISNPADVINWLWLFTIVSMSRLLVHMWGCLFPTPPLGCGCSTSSTQLSHCWPLCQQGQKHNWYVIYRRCL